MNKSIYGQDFGPLILERGISSAGTHNPSDSLTSCSPVYSFYLFLPTSFEPIFRMKICIQRPRVWECASPMSHTTPRDGLRSLQGLEPALVPRAALPEGTLQPPAWHQLAQPPHASLPCLHTSGTKCWQSSHLPATPGSRAEAVDAFLLPASCGREDGRPKDGRHRSCQRGGSFQILQLP